MILVIDVGNTRLKWAWLTSTGLSDQQAVVHRDAKPGLWTAALFESGQKPKRVLISNVAGPSMAKTLTKMTKKAFNVPAEFVTAAPEFHGLVNGYLDPKLLGADRWLALVGAWTKTRSALCVVDAGTAVKVDSIDAAGHHLGGLIVPGIHMMREALMSKTSDIAKAAESSTPSLAGVLANNTVGAVSRGAVFALAGMADRAAEVIEQSTGVKPKLFITGGDAGMITGTMRSRGEIVPDLVLQGLAVIAGQSASDLRARASRIPLRPGSRNLITDVSGLSVGHATDEAARTGVTALVCAADWAAGVDVRGGGPGVRETETLAPENLVGRAHAIVLAGGSVFGLAAADGAASVLSARDVGLRLKPDSLAIPIVPSAVLHDLANGGDKRWGATPPYRHLGIRALESAGADFALGSVGAGRGAMAGLVKGGVGSASLAWGDGLVVGALVAVNSVGSAFMPDGKTLWAWAFELDGEFGGSVPPSAGMDLSNPVPEESRLKALGRWHAGANTTLGVVACNADLSTAECKRVAMMAHDGIARAIRPAHTPFDGDTVFSLASGAIALGSDSPRATHVARIGSAAADCLARAIARAVHHA